MHFETLVDLDADAECDVRYILPDVLPEAQVGAFIAGKKTLKTGISADLGYSIATGTPFLNVFPVERPGRVVFISGEVGRAGLKEWFSRIAESRGMSLRDAADLEVCSDLPNLSSGSSIRYVAERCCDAALCVIDPMYMAFNVSGEDAKNVYAMGEKLRDLNRITQVTGCSMLVLHHAKNANTEKYSVGPSLSDVAFTGVGELARFWLLTKHRVTYRHGKGSLYFRTGGQSGHEIETLVDLDEGVRVSGDPKSRYWRTVVRRGGATTPDSAAPKNGTLTTTTPKDATDEAMILTFLRSRPEGVTVNTISENAFAPKRKRKEGVAKILDRLRAKGRATSRAKKARGKNITVWIAV